MNRRVPFQSVFPKTNPSLAKLENTVRIPGVDGSHERRFRRFYQTLRSTIMAVTVELDKCNGCGECVSSCPLDSIVITDEKAVIDDSCAECGACIDACPNKALVL